MRVPDRRLVVAFFVCLVVATGCGGGGGTPSDGTGDGGGTGGPTLDRFEKVWTDFDRNYSHFAVKGVDWDAIHATYRPRFLEELDEAEFLNRIASMLAELRDLHVWLLDSSGTPVEVYARPGARNWLGGYLPKYFPHGVTRLEGKYPLRHGWLDAAQTLAYMNIESFDGTAWDGLRTSELDGLFASYGLAAGMVIDVRQNNGGSEIVAAAIAGYLTPSAVKYGHTETRIPGDDHDAFEAPVDHVLDPAAANRYTGPVAVLMGEVNMSSAEWFIMMMDNCPETHLMGDTSRGSSGNPQAFTLEGGIEYGIPSWNATGERWDYTLVEIEDNGIDPYEWWAPAASYDETTDTDHLLEAAIDYLTTP